jgi:hypothetical protein
MTDGARPLKRGPHDCAGVERMIFINMGGTAGNFVFSVPYSPQGGYGIFILKGFSLCFYLLNDGVSEFF